MGSEVEKWESGSKGCLDFEVRAIENYEKSKKVIEKDQAKHDLYSHF